MSVNSETQTSGRPRRSRVSRVRKAVLAIAFALFCAGVVVAGGLGNAIDRFALGYVVDFIEPVFIDFPVFNVADIGVTCGFVLFFAGMLWSMRKDAPAKEVASEEK